MIVAILLQRKKLVLRLAIAGLILQGVLLELGVVVIRQLADLVVLKFFREVIDWVWGVESQFVDHRIPAPTQAQAIQHAAEHPH